MSLQQLLTPLGGGSASGPALEATENPHSKDDMIPSDKPTSRDSSRRIGTQLIQHDSHLHKR